MPVPGARLRVAIDMSLAVVGMTGVERYAAILHSKLAARGDIEVRSFAAGWRSWGSGGAGIGITRRYRIPLRVLHRMWRTVHLPRAEQLAGGADLVHALGGLPPPTRRPLVVTVHDLLPLTHPRFFIERTIDEARGLARALPRAAIVVTTCGATADEIVRLTSFPRDRIVVAPLGPRASGEASPGDEGEPYLLAVGAITPRKAFDVLAEAAALLGPSCPPVLIAGPDGFFADRMKARVAEADVHHRVRFLGPVDDDRLDELIANATIVCHTSLAEGFGMVCLEAMNHGRAVVAADIPSIREIGSGTVTLVPPGDATALAGAIDALLRDPRERIRRGRAAARQAAHYSWDRFASEVVGAYQRAVAETTSL